MSISRRTFFASLAGVAAGAAIAPFAVNEYQQPSNVGSASVSDPTWEVFGAVRLLSTGPVVLNDAGHTPHGVTGAEITSAGYLQINHTDIVEVGYAELGMDEYLTNLGVIGGVSQSFEYARARLFSTKLNRALNLNDPDDYAIVAGSTSNVWFYSRSTD